MGRLVTRTSVSAADTTPDAFTFTDQTGVATSSTITSAAITVAGINSAATISVTGGTYDINSSGSFTSSSGTVSNGDTVRARHTSSASNSTATNTVVTIGGVSDTFTSTTTSGSSLVAPASGLTYENRKFVDMNFANDSAALAGGVDAFNILGSGERAWVTDPAGGSNVLRTRYVVSEDASLAGINFTDSKYVYFQWSEYWHASFGSNMNGKCNRLISRIGGTVYLDHILFGAPGDDYYGAVMQGSDDITDPEHTGRSPALNRGAWYDIAVEHKVSSGSDGYWKVYQRTSGGSWTMLPLDFRQYPHTGGDPYLTNQAYFVGQTALNNSHLYNEAWVGGWRSGSVSGTNNYRYIKDVLVLYNVSNAPT